MDKGARSDRGLPEARAGTIASSTKDSEIRGGAERRPVSDHHASLQTTLAACFQVEMEKESLEGRTWKGVCVR